MSYDNDIPAETLALYAMRLLEPDEHAEIEAWLRHSPSAQQELAQVTSDLAAYAVTAEMHSPPALARQRLLKQMARERKAGGAFKQTERSAAPASTTPFASYAAQTSAYAAQNHPAVMQRPTRRLPSEIETNRSGFSIAMALGWALAAGLAVTAYTQYNYRISAENNMRAAQTEMVHQATDAAQAHAIMDTLMDPTAQRVNLTRPDVPPPGPSGKVIYVPEKGMLTFIATGLDPLQPYKTYELWLIPADSQHPPIPAGTFKPDDHGNASVMLPELPKGMAAKAFGVTVEDDGGAQTPTMPIVLAGA